MTVRLHLPREAGSVPAVRRFLRCTLGVLHVDRAAGDDLEIAIAEACANVVRHAGGAESFDVRIDVAEDHCSIDVRDEGSGFDPAEVGARSAAASNERGRGLHLIRALGENVRMHSSPHRGSLIHFEKSFA